MSARYTRSGGSPASTSRTLSDGSRISVGARGVSGGSNGSSVRIGGGGGGGGSSSSSAAGGGGGGGGSASAKGAELSSDRTLTAVADASSASAGSGIFSYGEPSSSASSNNQQEPVSTLGDPTIDRSTGHATGGQRVEFSDAGMGAAVVGNRVYFNNVELVTADQPFEVLSGTRIDLDTVMMESGRMAANDNGSLNSFNTRGSTIKLELESGTVVTFTMYTESGNSLMPQREVRTWTVRIR